MGFHDKLHDWDDKLIKEVKKASPGFARFALFLVYFWFGFLKTLGSSPANPLVEELQQKTLPFLSFEIFIVLFSVFEMIIGIMFLFSRFDRATIILFFAHMAMTLMPLVFLPQTAWQGFLTPTLEGQYMIKNIILMALVLNMGANLKPMKSRLETIKDKVF